jgi:hypothetical protein
MPTDKKTIRVPLTGCRRSEKPGAVGAGRGESLGSFRSSFPRSDERRRVAAPPLPEFRPENAGLTENRADGFSVEKRPRLGRKIGRNFVPGLIEGANAVGARSQGCGCGAEGWQNSQTGLTVIRGGKRPKSPVEIDPRRKSRISPQKISPLTNLNPAGAGQKILNGNVDVLGVRKGPRVEDHIILIGHNGVDRNSLEIAKWKMDF